MGPSIKYVGNLEGEISKFILNFVKDRPKTEMVLGEVSKFWEKVPTSFMNVPWDKI